MSENTVTTKKTNRIAKFFKETKVEVKKVTWPSKKQLIHNTLIILAFIIITGIILAICDVAFSSGMSALTQILK